MAIKRYTLGRKRVAVAPKMLAEAKLDFKNATVDELLHHLSSIGPPHKKGFENHVGLKELRAVVSKRYGLTLPSAYRITNPVHHVRDPASRKLVPLTNVMEFFKKEDKKRGIGPQEAKIPDDRPKRILSAFGIGHSPGLQEIDHETVRRKINLALENGIFDLQSSHLEQPVSAFRQRVKDRKYRFSKFAHAPYTESLIRQNASRALDYLCPQDLPSKKALFGLNYGQTRLLANTILELSERGAIPLDFNSLGKEGHIDALEQVANKLAYKDPPLARRFDSMILDLADSYGVKTRIRK